MPLTYGRSGMLEIKSIGELLQASKNIDSFKKGLRDI